MFLTASFVAFAEPHGGRGKETKPVPASKAASPVGPDCVDRASGDFSANFELAKKEVFKAAVTFFAERKSKFTPALVADWENISWPDQFRKSAQVATQGRRHYRQQVIDQVNKLVATARLNRSGNESSDKDKVSTSAPTAEGSESLRDWVRANKREVTDWLRSNRYEEVAKRIQALPEVIARRQAIEKENAERSAELEKLRKIVSDARSKFFHELLRAEEARGTPFDKIDQSLLGKQANELVEGAFAETLREIEEMDARIEANQFELGITLGESAFSAGHWAQFAAMADRRSARRMSAAERAIGKYLAENTEDLFYVHRVAEIAAVHSALDELKDRANLQESEDKAETEGKALSKAFESLAKVFSKGATVGVGFAVGVTRNPDGSV